MNRYEGRRALVTGGGSGIGQATVLRMLREGGTSANSPAAAAAISRSVTAFRRSVRFEVSTDSA